MSNRGDRIPVNAYVKLKKGFDETDIYRRVDAGATGWVRESKIDDDGFPMIFIEWDETNPNYAGEMDKWAFESHFEILSTTHDQVDIQERYIENIRIATDAALASDAFLLIGINKTKTKNGKTLYEPMVLSGELNNEAYLILEAQIAYMASTLFQEYIQSALNTMKIEDKTNGDMDDESGR